MSGKKEKTTENYLARRRIFMYLPCSGEYFSSIFLIFLSNGEKNQRIVGSENFFRS
jgi:hypothetical protein